MKRRDILKMMGCGAMVPLVPIKAAHAGDKLVDDVESLPAGEFGPLRNITNPFEPLLNITNPYTKPENPFGLLTGLQKEQVADAIFKAFDNILDTFPHVCMTTSIAERCLHDNIVAEARIRTSDFVYGGQEYKGQWYRAAIFLSKHVAEQPEEYMLFLHDYPSQSIVVVDAFQETSLLKNV